MEQPGPVPGPGEGGVEQPSLGWFPAVEEHDHRLRFAPLRFVNGQRQGWLQAPGQLGRVNAPRSVLLPGRLRRVGGSEQQPAPPLLPVKYAQPESQIADDARRAYCALYMAL